MAEYARCNFGAGPVHPGDAKAVRDYAATLRARQADPTVHWRELAGLEDPGGPYWRQWHCSPPPPGRMWRVVPGGEEWDLPADGVPVRRIYQVEIAAE